MSYEVFIQAEGLDPSPTPTRIPMPPRRRDHGESIRPRGLRRALAFFGLFEEDHCRIKVSAGSYVEVQRRGGVAQAKRDFPYYTSSSDADARQNQQGPDKDFVTSPLEVWMWTTDDHPVQYRVKVRVIPK